MGAGDIDLVQINFNNEHFFEYRVHLVQSGQLAGSRILKYRFTGERAFRGFAFITRTTISSSPSLRC